MPWLQLREVLEASRICNWVLKENFMAFDRGNSQARQNSFGFGDRDRTESQSAVAPGNFSEAELIEMITSLFASVSDYNPYAGIGSRENHADTCEEMEWSASTLEKCGITLSSGFMTEEHTSEL